MKYNLKDKRSQELHDQFTILMNRLEKIEAGRIGHFRENGDGFGDEPFGERPSQGLLIAVNDGLLEEPRAIASEIENLFRDLDPLSPLEPDAWVLPLANIEEALDELENELARYSSEAPD